MLSQLSEEMVALVAKANRVMRVIAGWGTHDCHQCFGRGENLKRDANSAADAMRVCGYCHGVGKEWYRTSDGYAWALENVSNGGLLGVREFLALPEVIAAESKL